MADRDAVWQPEKQRVQSGRHAYDRTGEDRQVDVSLLEVLGVEVADLLAVKEDVG